MAAEQEDLAGGLSLRPSLLQYESMSKDMHHRPAPDKMGKGERLALAEIPIPGVSDQEVTQIKIR
jgi:hypothetical protein